MRETEVANRRGTVEVTCRGPLIDATRVRRIGSPLDHAGRQSREKRRPSPVVRTDPLVDILRQLHDDRCLCNGRSGRGGAACRATGCTASCATRSRSCRTRAATGWCRRLCGTIDGMNIATATSKRTGHRQHEDNLPDFAHRRLRFFNVV